MTRWFSSWLRRPLRRPPRAVRGQAIIMMAIMVPTLIGFVGLVADVGMVYVTKARLQNSVDAAALAGAHGLPDPGSAGSIACTYIAKNLVSNMTGAQCSGKADVDFFLSNTKIRVTAHRTVPSLIAHLFVPGSQPSANVVARASALIGSAAANCIFPLFLKVNQAQDPFTSAILSNGSKIDVGTGSVAVRNAMQPGPCGARPQKNVGDKVDLQAGAPPSIADGYHDRLVNVASSSCPNGDVNTYKVLVDGQYQLRPDLTLTNCPRLVIVPVLPTATYSGNEKAIPIMGFAALWIRDYCAPNACVFNGTPVTKGDAWVYFIPLYMTSAKYTTFNNFGTKIVVMTE